MNPAIHPSVLSSLPHTHTSLFHPRRTGSVARTTGPRHAGPGDDPRAAGLGRRREAALWRLDGSQRMWTLGSGVIPVASHSGATWESVGSLSGLLPLVHRGSTRTVPGAQRPNRTGRPRPNRAPAGAQVGCRTTSRCASSGTAGLKAPWSPCHGRAETEEAKGGTRQRIDQ